MHDGHHLCVLVKVADDDVTAKDRVEVLYRPSKWVDHSKKRQLICSDFLLTPIEHSHKQTTGGYEERMVFDLSQAPFEDPQMIDRGQLEKELYYPIKVRVVDFDRGATEPKVISPSLASRGASRTAGIRLLWTSAPPEISQIDNNKGDFHDQAIDLAMGDEAPFLPSNSHTIEEGAEGIPIELRRLVGRGWIVRSYKYGDLSGQKSKDAALVAEKLSPENTKELKLIIAMRKSDGRLHKVIDSGGPVFNGASPQYDAPDVSINNRCVLLHQDGGTRIRTNEILKFKEVGGQWSLVQTFIRSYDHNSADECSSTTINDMLTGRVSAAIEACHKVSDRQDFYDLIASRGAPPHTGKWPAKVLVLDKCDYLETGLKNWKGPSDLSASIRALHKDKILNLLVSVTDDDVEPEDRVEIVYVTGEWQGKPGSAKLVWHEDIVPPTSTTRLRTKNGYQQRLTIDLSKLHSAEEPESSDSKPADAKASASEEKQKQSVPEGGANSEANTKDADPSINENEIAMVHMPLKVRIVDHDKGSTEPKVMSPSLGAIGTSRIGGIMLLWTSVPPRIEEIHTETGSFYYQEGTGFYYNIISLPAWPDY